MIQVNTYPPNIGKIKKVLPIDGKKGLVFTYGHAIHNPDMAYLDTPLEFHEAMHSLQQDKLGAEAWWDKYLADPQFRLSQEVEAYHQQYKKYCKIQKDRNKQAQYLHSLVVDCSSEIYGTMVGYSEARNLIKNGKEGR